MKLHTNLGPVQEIVTLEKSTKIVASADNKKSKIYSSLSSQFSSIFSTSGQPTTTFTDLRNLAKYNPFVAVAIEKIKQKVAKTPYVIRTKQEGQEKQYQRYIDRVEELLSNPNYDGIDNTFRTIMLKTLNDVLTFDYGVIEKVRNANGEVLAMYQVDGATIFPQFDESGILEDIAYKQFLNIGGNLPVNTVGTAPDAEFAVQDLMVFMASPYSEINRYGRGQSPVERVLLSVVSGIQALTYNTSIFDEGSLPPAMINLKGVQTEEIIAFKQAFMNQLTGKSQALAFTNAEDLTVNMLRPNNQEMQFYELNLWLARIVIASFGLSPEEFGLTMDSNRNVSKSQLEISKESGIASYLDCVAEEINKDLIGDLALNVDPKFAEIEFTWDVGSSTDPLTQAQIDQINTTIGTRTVDELRNRDGLDPLETIQPQVEAVPQDDLAQKSHRSKFDRFYK